jgi:hypothetical protein
MARKLSLFKQILKLLILVALILLAVRWCRKSGSGDEMEIENTPMRVELIRNIAEIATISYKDEVVADSVEFYKNAQEQFTGNLEKLTDPEHFKYGIRSSWIKRRLTLIVKGEIRYGFDLTHFDLQVRQTDSTLRILLPKPVITDIIVTPSSTEVFLENGNWQDYEVNQLHNKARRKLIQGAANLQLEQKAKANMEQLLKQLIRTSKKLQIQYS